MADDVHRLRRSAAVTAAMYQGLSFLNDIFEFCDSDSEDDYDGTEIEIRRRVQLRGPPRKVARIGGYVENTVPRFQSKQFREHFRMIPETFEYLENRLGSTLSSTEGRATVPVRKQLLSVLWLLATPDSYRSVGDRFDMGKSSLSKSFMKVVSALGDLSADIIKWPKHEELDRVKEAFNRKSPLHGIIGAIDGTHIPIKAPHEDAEYYKTYKKQYAITLQAVCDSSLKFTDTFAKLSGRVGDLRVLRNSDLYRDIMANKQEFFPHDEFIVGDKAYPVLSWCIPPYIDRGQLTPAQINFNCILSAIRSIVERAFALLKGRFRRLKYLDMNKDTMIPATIIACTVLHNICLGVTDDIEDFIEEGQDNAQNEHEIHEGGDIPNDIPGEAKRDYLCAMLYAEC